ncbi:MAG: hypothetical protein CMP59_04645 [Flavobacteriales bacterium]|nr:hypothetical protein [Flavobacteriales bacterium]
MKNIVGYFCISTMFLLFSCATYYQQRISFQRDFSSGNIEGAQNFLMHHKKATKKKDRLLYFLDRGVVEQMLGNYDSSNYYFEKAYIYNQDFKRNLATDLAMMVSNPMVRPYKSEDYEVVMVHYYKAINYLMLNKPDEALIEVRRINIRLNEQSDIYEGKRYRYKEDAFAHLLMGIIYESKYDINNAFIAYRNAYETYKEVYPAFGVQAPDQLKKDLLRTASQLGFNSELEFYEKEFGMKAEKPMDSTGTVVFFWLNGLSPVKGEISLNLTTTGGDGGAFVFTDQNEGVSVPIVFSNPDESSQISDLKFVRVAIPKFDRRDPLFHSAMIQSPNGSHQLETAENISEIAIANLEDRLLKEFALTLGRIALKQAAEAAAREQDENLGAAVSFVNALTEKADTRNWQTLPYSISYQRIPLKAGENELTFEAQGVNSIVDTATFEYSLREGETVFQTYHSLASTGLNY